MIRWIYTICSNKSFPAPITLGKCLFIR
uniref:Uncharacterized protein n=1 Tax=Arundo donax TaxID=35708 RepID=A0A0A9GIE9_ARUDO